MPRLGNGSDVRAEWRVTPGSGLENWVNDGTDGGGRRTVARERPMRAVGALGTAVGGWGGSDQLASNISSRINYDS